MICAVRVQQCREVVALCCRAFCLAEVTQSVWMFGQRGELQDEQSVASQTPCDTEDEEDLMQNQVLKCM